MLCVFVFGPLMLCVFVLSADKLLSVGWSYLVTFHAGAAQDVNMKWVDPHCFFHRLTGWGEHSKQTLLKQRCKTEGGRTQKLFVVLSVGK